MLTQEAGTSIQNICVTLPHMYNIVMDEKVIPIMCKSDVDESDPRVQLVGQVKVLSLAKPEDAVDTTGIMGSRNAQCRH